MERETNPELQQKLEVKRFVLSPEKFAKERIKKLREAFNELKEQFPEVISMNLYGSMSKGYAEPESDADTIIFIDKESLSEELDEDCLENSLKQQIKEVFKQKIADKFGLAEDVINNYTISVDFLSTEEINRDIDYLSEKYKHNMPESYFDQGQECFAAGARLATMFIGVSIGDNSKYRSYLLNKLKKMGEIGEKIWHTTITYTRRLERTNLKKRKKDEKLNEFRERRDSQYSNLYPETIDEAIERYNIKEVSES